GYMKSVKAKLAENGASEEEVAAFEKGASGYAKKIVANFKDYEFYTGEGMNPEGMVALLNYREDGITPYFTRSSSKVVVFLALEEWGSSLEWQHVLVYL
ncbi:9229_t:CDS:2, partial [Acaulospora colombiana]